MTTENQEKKVAIVVADGFEQVELDVPRQALQKAGFAVEIVSPGAQSTVQGYHHQEKGDAFPIDVPLSQARPEFYAALLLPGGVHNPDELRQNPKVLDFVRHFFALGKPVAAICHGPWTLIDAAVVCGRRLTSWPSIKTDLVNAGAEWVDEPVVVDRGLVTSRGPHDLAAFCKKMIEEFQQESGVIAQDAAMLAKLNELIKNIKVAMLTMRLPDGSLSSCPMMTQGKRFDRSLWFFTAASSCKGHEAEKECQVNVSYADPGANRYVSVSGRARLVRDRAKLQEFWTPLVKAWFPKGLDDPELSLLQVQVERAEYWDTPAGNATTLFQLAKLLLTGRPYQGEGTAHKRIALEPARGEAALPRDATQDAGPEPGKRPDQGAYQGAAGDATGEAASAAADDASGNADERRGKDTGMSLSKDTGMSLSKDTGMSLSKDTGMSLSKDTGMSLSKDTGMSLSKDTGMSLSKDTGMSLSKDTGIDLDTEPSKSARAGMNGGAGKKRDTEQDQAVPNEPPAGPAQHATKTRVHQEHAAEKGPADRAATAPKSAERPRRSRSHAPQPSARK